MAESPAPRLLRAADHRRMPWKNGGGETREIALSPDGAALDCFDWRVSMATVAIDGPFSQFPGVDRTLVLLEGDGMTLAIDGRAPIRLNTGDAPLGFPADVATTATLVEGAITDLNVMTRRGRFGHAVARLTGRRDVAVAEGATVLAFGDGARIETDAGALTLGYRDCARIDGRAKVAIGPARHGDALLIRIWPLA